MNVGDYVRTKDGVIQKITDVFNTSMKIATDRGEIIYRYIDIVKSSPQIIDLIQCSDYVNDYKVIGIVKGFKILVDKLELDTTTGLYHHKSIMAKNIKTIVTHEQMEAMQYRVEE